MTIFIIIPVHNRKQTPLKCLDILKKNDDLDKYHVVVVNDGSSNSTSHKNIIMAHNVCDI
ncbi:glycosyltransferase [Synechocystis sp. LEGE 06083]|uniref:glycosyltransferase family 2 protein n=1 Tax=Synechocystis sp. LEGE 06083 TaxID=915336 RepID=UPI00188220B2|nr:glycosyltransferase [Synechocystis sp. LEGE 06083]